MLTKTNREHIELIGTPGATLDGYYFALFEGEEEYDSPERQGLGVGILDQLPEGAQLIDSVGVVEGGGGDRDRVPTTAVQGYPGIHVHQPTSFIPGGNVTWDAVSRRLGQNLPNSTGVWYNGDIPSGDAAGPITYANDSFFISVVAPDGAVLTPDASNILRTVFFIVANQNKEVAEVDGSVTLTIERTGTADEAVSVTYTTVDTGSATAHEDFVSVIETLEFAVGEFSKEITIELLDDDLPEGFERFRVDITDMTSGYLITNGLSTKPNAINGEALVTVADGNVLIKSFQNDADVYEGTFDAYIDGDVDFQDFVTLSSNVGRTDLPTPAAALDQIFAAVANDDLL